MPPVFICGLGITGRLPNASPTWSLILSRLEVEGTSDLIVLMPLTAGTDDFIVVVADGAIPCCLID